VYTDDVLLTKIAEGLPAVIYLGALTALPTATSEGDLIIGDYFLCAITFIDTVTYTKGVLYAWDGASWVEETNSEKIMASMDDFTKLDVDAESLVVGNLFAKRFIAMEATIKQLGALYIKLLESGCIHSDYYNTDGTVNPSSTATKGLFLGADGRSKLFNSEVLGTLRTGVNAPSDARVGIRDEIGITSGPTFTGTGVDDMTIVSDDGLVAGDIIVKVNDLDNADNQGTEAASFAPITPFSTASITGMCQNASGRIVATTASGYILYSDDGITFTAVNTGSYSWSSVVVNSSGLFVAVGGYYGVTSSDGATWGVPFAILSPGYSTLNNLVVDSSGVFVVLTDGGIHYSTDGTTWSAATIPDAPGGEGVYWKSLAVNSNDVFVIGGTEDTEGEDGVMAYATYSSGLTFSTPFYLSPYILYPRYLSTDGATFFLTADNAKLYTSTNGSTWTLQNTSTPSGRVLKISSTLFLLISGSRVYSSSDGVTFSAYYTLTSTCKYGIMYAGRIIIYGSGGYIARGLYQDSIVWTDDAGSSWSAKTMIPYSKQYTITGYDIVIGFSSTTGHTVADQWAFTQSVMKGLVIQDSSGTTFLDASNGVVEITQVNSEGTTNKVYGAVFN
jgi:hypothetical protein